MAHPDRQTLPEPLEPPDVGFVAAVGVYTALAVASLAVALALAISPSGASVVGSVTTAATVGLVVGSLTASGRTGLPERLGSRRRPRSLLFVVPAAFALASLVALTTPTLPDRVAFATGFGALSTTAAAFGLHSMGRTRYARVMAADDPLESTPYLNPRQVYLSGAVGVGCTAGSLLWLFTLGSGGRVRLWWGLLVVGLFSLLFAYSTHRLASLEAGDAKPTHRRRVLGTEWLEYGYAHPDSLPTLEVHPSGLVLRRPFDRRFVPWHDVTAVRLTDTTLVIERRGRLDLRCARSVLDDPERTLEVIDRARQPAPASATLA
ncbi:PH domain-containing protein [Natronobiforma cellulositropha]|uniref:PH domain-containing protein n=1 Tax=Natronobiforma cellulositropha TaxID=1679076 RepID=UPI0021D5805A|nr:PH domain-containing protein [Natronobiforma cellulositropha]